jgi:hypothetical protein
MEGVLLADSSTICTTRRLPSPPALFRKDAGVIAEYESAIQLKMIAKVIV